MSSCLDAVVSHLAPRPKKLAGVRATAERNVQNHLVVNEGTLGSLYHTDNKYAYMY